MNEKDLLELFKERLADRNKYLRGKLRRQASPQLFAGLLRNYFSKKPDAISRLERAEALAAWPSIIGAAAAQVSAAVRIRGQQLVISVKDPMWAQQLVLLKTDIIKKYQTRFPKLGIRDVFFSRDPG